MDTHIHWNTIHLPLIAAFLLFLLSLAFIPAAHATSPNTYLPEIVSAPIVLSYYYGPYPRYRYGTRYSYGRYWTGWRPINRYCQQRCLVNNWGRVIRCVQRCY
ncbi:hypothetical protein [Legionella oakridgensis]|uniref:Uncharacterized protein n=2 Tax=Legionella oakridgensis TaxID=29423 RepID=W0BFL0_9GAMM|nr:hypothetical protein [Legionella oakridgensis]AHE67229.1 hypothetical protein Loa_01682 [Legionella oakridgensis ATCC 33761 = DSM 21215]ETO93192.1 hypothetical protein LOR_48c09240 [Legionella oakridgensis RV-2-2007]KTD37973.1 hypothetical protein Loak_1649 [Legionella oakridgensis]STY20306.1 Uncharacterised protein [Legionella longbeachae]